MNREVWPATVHSITVLDMTEQLTLSPFRECFSNLKSLNLVIGSSLLPSVPELFTSVFIRHITYSMLSLICCVPLFPNYWLFFWYFSTIPGPRFFFYSVPQHPGVGLQVVFYPIGVESMKSTKSSKSTKLTLCQRNVSFGQLMVYTDWGGFTQELWGGCVCVCCCVSICRTHSVCLELSAIPSPTHPLPHLIKP